MTKLDDSPSLSPPGLFIVRGMQLSIPPGGFVITLGNDGNVTGELRSMHVRIDMCARWMKIAYQHLVVAESAYKRVLEANRDNDEQALGLALERESDAGMQAIAASCAAVDAYYALLREYTAIDEVTLKSWRDNRMARHKQIAEVIRRTFKMPQIESDTVRAILKQAFPIRDGALHPTAKMSAPMNYDEIDRCTARWLVTVRHENAKMVVGQCLMVVAATVVRELRSPSKEFADILTWTAQLIAPIVAAWREHYGPLGTQTAPASSASVQSQGD